MIKCTCDGLDVINSRCKEAGDEVRVYFNFPTGN